MYFYRPLSDLSMILRFPGFHRITQCAQCLWQKNNFTSIRNVQLLLSRCYKKSAIDRSSEPNSSESNSSESDSSESNLSKSNSSNVKSLLENAADYEQRDTPNDEWHTPVYPIGTNIRQDQARHSLRPAVDPTTTSVLLFPGQGSQFVGMGQSLLEYPNVPEMYTVASEILDYNLFDLCTNGPKSKLDKTVHCQVAVMVTSLAAVEKLRHDNSQVIENCVATAGFSVGEYTALVFTGALSFEDAVRLVKIRGEAMQAASELAPSGMMTVFLKPNNKINFACSAAKEWCVRQNIDNPECSISNFLFPGCRVISGNIEALKFIELNAADFGLKKIKHIAVSGGFHSKLMKPAEEVLQKALKTVEFKVPLVPVHRNVDGKRYTNAELIPKYLCSQLCSPVKWEQTMHIIYERSDGTAFPYTYECGPGKTLRTLLRMVNAKAVESCQSISV